MNENDKITLERLLTEYANSYVAGGDKEVLIEAVGIVRRELKAE